MVPRSYPSGVRANPVKISAELDKFKSVHSYKSDMATANWTYEGNTSVPGNGGGDGRVDHIRFYPGNPNTIFACSPSGGLWKSTDGGNTWATNTDNLGDLSISDIAIDPVNPNIMYMGTGDNENPGSGTPTTIGVLKSTNGGATWNATGLTYTLTYSGMYYMVINQMLINPDSTNIIFAASTFGLWKSVDSGKTWNNMLNDDIRSVEFEPFHSGTIFAGDNSGIFYRSTNEGKTFTQITSGLPNKGAARMTVGVTPADSTVVYVIAEDSANWDFHGLYKSTDMGQTFTLKSSPSIGSPNIIGYSNTGNDSSGFGWYSLPIAVSPTNADTIFAGGVNLWMSGDGGVTWSLNAQWTGSGAPYVHADQHHIVFMPGSSSTVLTSCDGGIFKTTDKGTTWTDYSNNLEIGQIYCLGLSSLTPGLNVSGWQDNGSNLSSPTWSQVLGGDGEDCFIDYTNDNNVFVSYQDGQLYYSSDGGSTFNYAANGITESGPWTTRWLQDPQAPSVIYAGFVNVWTSGDFGSTWSQMSTWGTSYISALKVAPSNDSYIYAAQPDSLFLTTNSGTSWACINSSLPVSVAYISAIAVSPTDPKHVWVTFSGYVSSAKVYESTDAGLTWKNVSTGLPNLPVNCIVYHPGTHNGIYVGTDFGVYYRDSLTAGWINYNTGLPNVVIDDLQIYSPSNTVVAGTFGRGEWETPAYVPVGINEVKQTDWANVYPNPSSGRINISMNLGKEGDYTLSITNMLGESIYTEKIHAVGIINKIVDMSTYAKGPYLLVVSNNASVLMQKKIVTY